uniref:Glycolipid transfer protein domain-containing protein n=1 Tax=Anolis carolinensis TaxID=28377 RepID=H9GFU7_ANOCA
MENSSSDVDKSIAFISNKQFSFPVLHHVFNKSANVFTNPDGIQALDDPGVFMDSLGTAFGLISRETWSKISVLEQHRAGRHGSHYRSVQAMVAYELGRGLVDFGRSQPRPAARLPSGCRTLLRLHRALKWLELFLHKLGGGEGGEGSREASQMCAEAYQAALAPFHSWWVRQAASLAFLAMPSRQELLRNICANEGPRQARGVLRHTVRSIARVYNATQVVYAGRGMLDLP